MRDKGDGTGKEEVRGGRLGGEGGLGLGGKYREGKKRERGAALTNPLSTIPPPTLTGNLHQSQYCEKIKSILEFLGQQLSMEELTTMWEMQVDKNPVQVSQLAGLVSWAS